MEYQRIFTPEYANSLKNDIHVENYLGDTIIYDSSEVRRLKNVEKPDGLEEKMLNAFSECDAAIILYENYKSLTPVLASKEAFWYYLTHVDLANYVKQLWPDLKKQSNEAEQKKYIRAHWLKHKNGTMRTSLMGLWWSVYLTVDEKLGEEHKYDLTKIFFSNNGMRTRRLGTGHLGRNREALKGILSFMKDNPDIFKAGIENKMIWITRHFNLIGGSLPLANKPSKYFYEELNKFKNHLRSIKSRDEVTGPDALI